MMRNYLQRMALLLLMLPLCMAVSAVTFVNVTRENSKVTKVDVGEQLSSITLTVTLGADEALNGQAQLRSSTDETALVNNGSGFLSDNVLKQKTENPNVWEITWLNVPVGKYKVYFQQSGGTTHTFLHEVEIVEIPSTDPPVISFKVKDATCNTSPTDTKNGSITVNVEKGVAPFTYKATIHHADNTTEEKTLENTPNRAWIVDGLASGEYIDVTVTDSKGKTVTKKSELVGFGKTTVSIGQTIFIKQTGDCTFDYYLRATIETENQDALDAQTELLAQTLKLRSYADKKYYDVEHVPAYDMPVPFGSGQYYRFYKVASAANLSSQGRNRMYGLKYSTLCSGEKTTRDYYAHVRTLDKMMNFSTSSKGSLNPTDCSYQDAKFTIKYDFQGGYNRGNDDDYIFSYYFMDEAHRYAKLFKKNEDGTYPSTPVKADVPMPINEFDTRWSQTIEVAEPGTYKFVYGSDCDQVRIEKEIVVEPIKPEFKDIGDWMSPTINQELGIHGNTAGLAIGLANVSAPLTLTVKRLDDKREFVITDFADDKPYTKHIDFPQDINYDKLRDAYFIADLPAGKYALDLKDNCNNTATYNFEIPESKLQHYKPKRDEGYKDGVYVGVDCNGNNVVKFDFGPEGDNVAYAYKTSTGEQGSSGSRKTWASNVDPITPFEKLTDTNYFGAGFAPSLYNGHSYSEGNNIYSAIAKEDRYYNSDEFVIRPAEPGDYARKTYKFDFADYADKAAFEVFGAMCNRDGKGTGMVSVGVAKGVNVALPVKYELYKTEDGSTLTGEPLRTYKATTTQDVLNVVWKDVEVGKYLVRTIYNGTCEGKKFVQVSPTDIPEPSVETENGFEVKSIINLDITDGMKPLHLYLPVSPYIYNVEWYDITNTPEKKVFDGNDINVTFNEPGVYTYQVRTTFTDRTSCPGSSGGDRIVKFYVTKTDKPNYWVGSTSEDFSTASNWTANKVPTDNEDIVFATKENNNGHAAERDCRLTEGESPLMFWAASLINESGKAMVVPAGSALVVKSGTVGFAHEIKQDGSVDPVRLKIEASDKDVPNGTFIAKYPGAASDKVYAEVQMYVRSRKLEQPTSWTDNLEGSPTKGTTFPVKYTDQFFGIPFKEMSSGMLGGSYIYKYDEAHNAKNQFYQKFVGLKANAPMTAFAGYSIRNASTTPKMKTMKGYLDFNNVTLTLTQKASKVNGATSQKDAVNYWGLGQNLFGNSYTAPISSGALVQAMASTNKVENTAYLYRTGSGKDWGEKFETDDEDGAGSYQAVPLFAASDLAFYVIPSMQGFLLKFLSDEVKPNGDDAVLTLDYNRVVTLDRNSPQLAKRFGAAPSETSGSVKFELTGEHAHETMWLLENANTSDDFDNGWDGFRLGAESMPTTIYSNAKPGMLQVNTTDDLTKANITVKTGKAGNYTLTLTRRRLNQYPDLKLVDLKLQQLVPFDGNKLSYMFTAGEGEMATDRFTLVNTTATSFADWAMSVSSVENDMEGEVSVYTLSGHMVAQFNLPQDKNLMKNSMKRGVYILSVKNGTVTNNRKYIVK